jgi:hypothetical protein
MRTKLISVLTAVSEYVQARLERLHIRVVGGADGQFGPRTANALCVFRYLDPTLRVTTGTIRHRDIRRLGLTERLPGKPRYRRSLEILPKCQMMLESRHGRYIRAIPVSTGRPGHQTPSGRFKVDWKQPGWHESNIYSGGMMYDSLFFTSAGHAIHGSTDVPPFPASHGCVRVSVDDANGLFGRTSTGTRIVVHPY